MHSDITKNDIRIFLHKPNRDSLGEIKFFTVPQQKPELGKVNRLDFVIPYYFEQNEYRNEDGNFNDGKKKNKYFDLVKERFLLKVKWLEHEEWYIVDDIVENADVNSDTKRVTAYSLPYEMRGIRLFDWPGVLVHGEYRKESLLLEQVANNVLQQTMWKIKWIDPDLTGDNAKFRFFDFSDELTVLEALYEIAEEFQSIIEFDTENREIYFHHQDNYGRDKRYLLSHNRYLKTIQNEVKPNEIITRIVPVGKDGITINERNATGSPYLQDFSYYMQPFQRDTSNVTVLRDSINQSSVGSTGINYDYRSPYPENPLGLSGIGGQTVRLNINPSKIVESKDKNFHFQFNLLNPDTGDMYQFQVRHQHNQSSDVFFYDSTTDKNFGSSYESYTSYLNGSLFRETSGSYFPLVNSSGDGENFEPNLEYQEIFKNIKHVTAHFPSVEGEKIRLDLYDGKNVLSVCYDTDNIPQTVPRMINVGFTANLYDSVNNFDDQINFQMSSVEGKIEDIQGDVIKSSDWLSDSLCHALLDYSELVKQKEEEYADLLNVRELLIRDLSDKETEIFNTELELFIVQDLIDVKQSQGENASSELSQENDLEVELNTLWDEWDDIDQSLNSNQQSLEDITVELSVENNFTEEQYNELSPFINTEVWKNDNLFTVEDLTEAAKDYFATINFPKRKMTISLVDFLDLVEVDEKLKDVQLGDKFNLYYERFNINVQIQVIAMDINYGTGSVVLTIANVKDIFKNDNDEIAKLIYQNKMVSGSVMKNKPHWDKAPQIEADLNRYTTGSFDSSLQEIMSGVDNSVTVNRRGITVTNMNDPNHFLRITNGAMLITRDGGETAALAISPEGLHAEVIFGRLLTGERLVIEDEEGTFVIQGNILKITDRNDRTRVELGEYEPNQFGLRVFNKAGTQTVLDEDGILQTWQEGKADNVDSSNGLSLWVYLPPETLSVRQARLNFRLLPFRAYSRGTSSGGSSSPTSVAGGGSTQASLGGGSVSKSTLSGGSYGDSSAAGGDHHHVMFTFENDIPLNMSKRRYHVRDSIVVNLETQSGTNLQTAQSSGNHTHSFWVPNHTHEFSVPSHTHNVVIPNHSHVVNIPAHTHGIDYGIYTSTAAANVGVWINGTNRTSALGGTFASSRSNLNITQYMQTGQWNEIVLTSSRLGRLDANVFVQAFMST